MWKDIDLSKYIKNLNGCTDKLRLSIPSHMKVWSFDKIVQDHSKGEFPHSMDCLLKMGHITLFIEFKSSFFSEINLEDEFFNKAIDSIAMYWRCLSQCEKLKSSAIHLWFVIKDEPLRKGSKNRDAIKNVINSKCLTMKSLSKLEKRKIKDKFGHQVALFCDKIQIFRQGDFEKVIKNLKIDYPR